MILRNSGFRDGQVSTLVFTGCNFPNCPRASIYEAGERDFRFVAIDDAISGFYDQGRVQLLDIGVMVVETESYLKKVADPTSRSS